MITYPFKLDRRSYADDDAKDREEAEDHDRDATKIEDHVNRALVAGTTMGVIGYQEIARSVGMTVDRVKRVMGVFGDEAAIIVPRSLLRKSVELRTIVNAGTPPAIH